MPAKVHSLEARVDNPRAVHRFVCGPLRLTRSAHSGAMPLSALVDEELVCAPLLDEQQWAQLKGHPVLLQPCGHRGFGRVSPLGTQHFVHERDSGCEHSESPEHLHLKAVIARAASEAGWQAATEVTGDGFVADVMAVAQDRQVAFEVQRSKQILRDYQHRQERYRQAEIRSVWFAKSVPAGYVMNAQLPLFVVSAWGGDPQVVVAGRMLPVTELVHSLLAGQVSWRDTVPVQQETSEVVRLMCPACGTRRDVDVSLWRQGRCVCLLPVLRQDPNPTWWEKSRCCGYWGPAIMLGRASRTKPASDELEQGHWCVQAPAQPLRVSA